VQLSKADQSKLEILEGLGNESYRRCQLEGTYSNLSEASAHWNVLQLGVELVDKYDSLEGIGKPSIPESGEWDELINLMQGSACMEFLALTLGNLDLTNVDVIGLSTAYIEQLAPALQLAKTLRQRKSSLSVVIGGGALTHILETDHMGESFFKYVDAAIPFEGEHSFLEYLNAIDSGTSIAQLENIATWDADKRSMRYVKSLANRPRVAAVPDYSDLELDHAFPTPSPVIPLLTSKGCYWGKCAYCTHHEGYGQGYFNFEESVFRDSVRQAVSLGFANFNFVDEAIPPKMVKRFAVLFKELAAEFAGIKIQWMAEARSEKSFNDPDFVEVLNDSGCRLLVSGIESGSQRVSDAMEKGIDLNSAAELAHLCKEKGIGIGWMFFIGFPGESDTEAIETFEYIRKHRESLLFASVDVFKLNRGSPLWKNPKKWNVKIQDVNDHKRIQFDYLNERNEVFTYARSKKLLGAILAEFTDLRPQMTTIPDRTAAYFLAGKDVRDLDRNYGLRYSRADGSIVVYQPFNSRCLVLRHSAGTALAENACGLVTN